MGSTRTRTGPTRRRGMLPLVAAVALVALVASGCLSSTTPVVHIDGARAFDVNEHGLVVGSRWLLSPISISDHAYSYDLATGTTTDLGSLGGPAGARAVNDSGVIVGYAQLATGATRAFRYTTATGMVDIGTLTPTATTPTAFARDINEAGAIVGSSSVETGAVDASHAFVRDPAGTMTDLGTLGGTNSAALAINDAGVVVGWSEIAGDAARHAFVYEPAVGHLVDLGTLGGADSQATALNNLGQIVGFSELPGSADPFCGAECPPIRGFVHDLTTGVTTQLGITLHHDFAYPAAINDDGIIVGSTVPFEVLCSHCTASSQPTGWELGTTNVHTIGRTYDSPSAITEEGLVAGTGFDVEAFSVVPNVYTNEVTRQTPP